MNKRFVVSLDLAKRMKELGFPQGSDFYWYSTKTTEDNSAVSYFNKATVPTAPILMGADCEIREYPCHETTGETVSAFHSAELGEILFKILVEPKTLILDPRGILKRKLQKANSLKNEVDARAKMLIYLVEKNLITIKT